MSRKSLIVIQAYNRLNELEKTISSIERALQLSNDVWDLCWLWDAEGDPSVLELLRTRLPIARFGMSYKTSRKGDLEPHHKISEIRYLAYKKFVDRYDNILFVEDDVVVSSDILLMSEFILDQKIGDYKFGGICYGSYSTSAGYGHITEILGEMNGQATLLTSKALRFAIFLWPRLGLSRHFDAGLVNCWRLFEFCVPLRSRYYDLGRNGTHMTADLEDHYFSRLERSFHSGQKVDDGYFIEAGKHEWWFGISQRWRSVFLVKNLIFLSVKYLTRPSVRVRGRLVE